MILFGEMAKTESQESWVLTQAQIIRGFYCPLSRLSPKEALSPLVTFDINPPAAINIWSFTS